MDLLIISSAVTAENELVFLAVNGPLKVGAAIEYVRIEPEDEADPIERLYKLRSLQIVDPLLNGYD